MLNRFNNLPIAQQILGILLAVNLIVFSVMITYISVVSTENASESARKTLLDEVKLIDQQFSTFNSSIKAEIISYVSMFERLFPGEFTIDKKNKIKTGNYLAYEIKLNGNTLNNDFTDIDEFSRITNTVSSVFVAYENDFLRVSTSLKKSDGTRAMGTLLGRDHPAYKDLMAGRSFTGKTALFGRDYMAHYQPIKDSSNDIIGIWFTAFDFTQALAQLTQITSQFQIGEQGYVFAATQPKGAPATAIIHPELAGRELNKNMDTDGILSSDDIFKNTSGVVNYQREEKGKTADKILVYKQFEEWDWVIGSIGYLDEFVGPAITLRNEIILMAIASVLILLALSFITVQTRLKPLERVKNELIRLGAGDLTTNAHSTEHQNQRSGSRNEITQVLSQLEITRDSFATLVRSLLKQISTLSAASDSLNVISNENNQVIARQNEESDQIATAITEMSASIRDVALNASQTSEKTNMTVDAVTDSSALMTESQTITQQAAAELKNAIKIIQQLSTDSKNVGGVLDVIGGIADQTNLLALNAAIEAARAGEQGRGFAVVADEVRTLAKRTQESTSEIKAIIDNLQNSSTLAVESVMEADEKSSLSVEYSEKVMLALETIAKNATEINDMTLQIATASEQQSAVSEEISNSSVTLSDSSKRSTELAEQTSASAKQLNEMADQLSENISTFKVD